jgi:hypothetical protein
MVRVAKTDANWFNPHHVTVHIHQSRGGLFEDQNCNMCSKENCPRMRMLKSGLVLPLAMLSFDLIYQARELYQRFGLQTVRIHLQNNTLTCFQIRISSAGGTAVKYRDTIIQ